MRVLSHLLLAAMISVMNTSRADDSGASASWQMSRLFHPSETDLVSEQKGRVMIYDGLTDITVDRALNEQFDRIDAMMFTRTIITDKTGNPLRDAETGEILLEDDGCD